MFMILASKFELKSSSTFIWILRMYCLFGNPIFSLKLAYGHLKFFTDVHSCIWEIENEIGSSYHTETTFL